MPQSTKPPVAPPCLYTIPSIYHRPANSPSQRPIRELTFFITPLPAYHLMKWPTAGVYLHSLGCKTLRRGSLVGSNLESGFKWFEAKFGSADPKSYADRLFCQELPLNPNLRLSPLAAPVDGTHKIPASFLRRFLREKLKLASECFRRSEMRRWSEDGGDWFMPLRLRISNHWSERGRGGMIKQIWSADASVLSWSL